MTKKKPSPAVNIKQFAVVGTANGAVLWGLGDNNRMYVWNAAEGLWKPGWEIPVPAAQQVGVRAHPSKKKK